MNMNRHDWAVGRRLDQRRTHLGQKLRRPPSDLVQRRINVKCPDNKTERSHPLFELDGRKKRRFDTVLTQITTKGPTFGLFGA